MRNKIFRSIAAGSAMLAMISGCFLDSVSWIPTITTFLLIAVSLVSAGMVDLDADPEEGDECEDVQGL